MSRVLNHCFEDDSDIVDMAAVVLRFANSLGLTRILRVLAFDLLVAGVALRSPGYRRCIWKKHYLTVLT